MVNKTLLKIKMAEKDFNQKSLAISLGISDSKISRLFNGVTAWNQETIEKTIKALDLTPRDTVTIFFSQEVD